MEGDEASAVDETERPGTPAASSRLRRWIVRVGIGVVVVFGACSFVLPSYRIPSGSMVPTLQVDDHMLVSRLAYGLGELERGDVILFRYPIDGSTLFFKRVIGLPGDEVEVAGERVSIKRAGASALEELPHAPREEPCTAPDGTPVARCTLYEETVDGKRYIVRYKAIVDERGGIEQPAQVWKVPEGHLFVLGDNRNDSLDSRRWTVETADGERPAPFLPVALVEGRAEWIWWPLSRWQAVQ